MSVSKMSISPDSDFVDVLIIGAGPAGLTAAKWLSQCGVKTLIVDRRLSSTRVGQADGIQARTLELLDSFGLADTVLREARPMGEFCMWNPDPDGLIRRTSRMPNTIRGLSRFRQGVILSQQRLEEILLDSVTQSQEIEFQRLVEPVKLDFNAKEAEVEDAYPITVSFRSIKEHKEEGLLPRASDLDDEGYASAAQQQNDTSESSSDCDTDPSNGSADDVSTQKTRTVQAKYLIGCDGAHSWTRRQLGFQMEGEQTDSFWGVLDIIPITDFPDIRSRCAIRSAEYGNIMLIPRENKLVRIYCQLNDRIKSAIVERHGRSEATLNLIFSTCQNILKPYKLTYKYCDWWSVYQIGQRVGTQFDLSNRIFLAGDAVHTHSPKAGQGMNVSMQDTYNLGWKLALVLRGFAQRNLLTTYGDERRSIATQLIAFDRHFSKMFSSRDATSDDRDTASASEFQNAFNDQKIFSAGFAVNYERNSLVAKDSLEVGISAETCCEPGYVSSKQHLATGIIAGKRFPSFKVLNQSDSQPWHLANWLKADGKFRIILFAGDVSQPEQMSRVRSFCTEFSRPESILRRSISQKQSVLSFLEILTVHSAPREAVELADFPEELHPFHEETGWDYDKIFVDAESYYDGHGEAYSGYGVNSDTGCVVLVRPDQYVGWIGDLEDVSCVEKYFAGFVASA